MAPAAKPKPSLRFQYPDALHKKLLSALKAVEGADDPTAHREVLAQVVVALTDTGLDAYFLEPLKQAKAGFLVQQSANLGLHGARQVMGSVIRNILGRMDGPQLLSVCGSIRRFMGVDPVA
ncbi:MAG: hypothetical protein IPL96_16505 [Holophagaceae bacterium]|nr:hypothetical protein [Holophagaceae bacterium]